MPPDAVVKFPSAAFRDMKEAVKGRVSVTTTSYSAIYSALIISSLKSEATLETQKASAMHGGPISAALLRLQAASVDYC